MADTLIARNISHPRGNQSSMQTRKSRKTPRRPVTPGKTKKKTGHDFWMTALKKRQALNISNTYRAPSPRHKSTAEYFVETLRKTGVGLSAETNKSQTMTGLKGANPRQYPYMSTSHYMRQVMGTERSHRGDDPTARPSAGTPNYKSQEEYYEEVLNLRKQIVAMNQDASNSKTRMRRLEEDNAKKEKEIEALLNPGKNGELRRTLGDRQADSSAVVHSLKQKILKLELQLREKESSFCKLQADLKTTKLDEMRVKMEVLYAEVLRLQMSKDTGVDKSRSGGAPTKVKALNETVIRLSRTNEQLQTENKALKDDLNKALEASDAKMDTRKDYADMNRAELLLTISKLEKRADRADSRMDGDNWSVLSQDSARKPQGKIELKGSLEDRLQQLDQRETELLDEVERLKTLLRRHKDDKRRSDDAGSLPPTPRRRNRDDGPGSRPQSGRRSYRGDEGSRPGSSRSGEFKVESFQQKHAATSIQRQWRQRKQRQHDQEEQQRAAQKIQSAWKNKRSPRHNVERFRENRAAKKIQHGWLDYKHRHYDEELDDAAYTIQSALRGHHHRRQRMHEWDPEDYESSHSETDDGVYLIQSSLRGHHSRTQQMRHWRSHDDDADSVLSASYGRRRTSPSGRPLSAQRPSSGGRPGSGGQYSFGRPGSAGQHSLGRPGSGGQFSLGRPGSSGGYGSRPGTGQRPSSSGQRPSSATKRGSYTFKARYDVPSPTHMDQDEDDDDDIMF